MKKNNLHKKYTDNTRNYKKNTNIAIQLMNVNKKYEIHHEKPTLVEKFIKGNNETFWALKDINLTIKKGEKVGLIGPNGSGKTTLLKVISGITHVNSGIIHTTGKVVSLIDLDAGFHPDLSGIQNIYLNSLLLGMNKKTIDSKLNDIITFAGLHKFIDVPLYTYSQGMQMRLGFSIAAFSDPEIIILDEGLAVGDIEFQNKCRLKLNELFNNKVTLIISLHVYQFIEEVCSRVIYLKNGRVHDDGSINIINKYR